MKNLETMKKENGFVIHNDSEVVLTQQAYSGTDFTHGNQLPAYFANGVDAEGNEYKIKWYPYSDESLNDSDESNACDWANPYSVVLA